MNPALTVIDRGAAHVLPGLWPTGGVEDWPVFLYCT